MIYFHFSAQVSKTGYRTAVLSIQKPGFVAERRNALTLLIKSGNLQNRKDTVI